MYDLPGGLMLCTPAVKFRSGSFFSNPANPNAPTHLHASMIPLDSLREDELETGRCACGTWTYAPHETVRNHFERKQTGRMIALANYTRMADTSEDAE
ncbi:hypothetical protein [Nocardioides dongxiaopingii]|uniref:hypothetical protein n=1 Tax=Nocardioides dongxiaopingii TaxID=2576036 RepID=UPI0010C769F5|nr:hypothetical protein [Nocardioides dongxiaopingii]